MKLQRGLSPDKGKLRRRTVRPDFQNDLPNVACDDPRQQHHRCECLGDALLLQAVWHSAGRSVAAPVQRLVSPGLPLSRQVGRNIEEAQLRATCLPCVRPHGKVPGGIVHYRFYARHVHRLLRRRRRSRAADNLQDDEQEPGGHSHQLANFHWGPHSPTLGAASKYRQSVQHLHRYYCLLSLSCIKGIILKLQFIYKNILLVQNI